MTCEWRTIKLVPVQGEVFNLWRQVLRIISADLGTRGTVSPSPTALAEAISLTIIQEYEQKIPPHYWDDVIEGRAHCWYPTDNGMDYTIPDTGRALLVCHSYANLERHHSVPRSLGGADSELVWLCASHHRAISDGVGGRDWRWLRQALGYATE